MVWTKALGPRRWIQRRESSSEMDFIPRKYFDSDSERQIRIITFYKCRLP